MQYRQAYLDALREFAGSSPGLLAGPAGAGSPEAGVLEFAYLGRRCLVYHPSGEILIEGWHDPPHEEKILILQYLTWSSGLPLQGRWLSFLELPGGPHHFAPFRQEALLPLARSFGARPESFVAAARSLGGKPIALGHAGMVIPAFPRLPLAFILWRGDEEFSATANILFDASAPAYLPTASLYMLGIAVAKRLLASESRV